MNDECRHIQVELLGHITIGPQPLVDSAAAIKNLLHGEA